MHRVRIISLLLALLLVPLGAEPRADRHVILITIDGFPAHLWPDPSLPLPNLRAMAAHGARARALSSSNPTVTWPNHTTLVTGVSPRRHGVLFNGYVTRQGPGRPTHNEPWTDKSIMVRVPTVYDAAHAAGLGTAECDWVAISRAGTIDWSFAELPDPNGKVAREMVDAGIASLDEIVAAHGGKQQRNIVCRDELWLRAAQFIFERHRPNLLLLHLLNTDSTHHRYGPGSLAGYSALALADRLVGELVRTVDATGLLKQTTFIVTTDHGFKKVQTHLYPNVTLKRAGLLRSAGARIVDCAAYAGAQGGIAFIYVTDPARRTELIPKLKSLFVGAEGVDRVIDGTSAPGLGMPGPDENQAMGDLILFARAGFSFSGSAAGEVESHPSVDYGGSHGYPADDPEMDGIFVASGGGIREEVVLDRVSNMDVAPTIAHLLDVPLPNVEGRVIDEILKPDP
ncbi:MAG: alkaline phosphatase family protein [Opitutaceae bacterium]|nr:alkaline phosphatase family protein [Opitutaceae bacterium]